MEPIDVKLFAFWNQKDWLFLVSLRIAHLLSAMKHAEGAEIVIFYNIASFLGGLVSKGPAFPWRV